MGMICNSYSINLCFANGKIVSTESGVENEARVWFSDRKIQEADVESFESIKSMIEDKILIFGCNLLSDDGSRFDDGFGDEDEYEDEEDDNVYKEEWERYWDSVLKYDYSDLCGVILMTLNDVVEGVNRIDYIFIHVKPSFKTVSGSKDQSFVKDASGRGSFVPDLSSFCRELIKDLPEDSEKALKGKTTANKSSKTSAKTTTSAKTESSKNASTATKKKSVAPISFNVSQFEGIHKVTKAPERVWIGNCWSIEVPVGFSYTADPEKASDVLGLLRFQLNIQNSKDCNFDVPFTSVFNVVVDEGLDFADLNCDDISDETFIQSLDALSDDYQIHKCSRDLVVLYKVSTESNEYSSCEFQVVTRGNNAIFSGRFACKEGTIDERKKNILHWLDTIDVLTQDEKISFTDYSGKSEIKIPTEYGEVMAPIDPGIRISVPPGFHAETNQAIIGNGLKLAIVPENYSFSDYLLDAPVLLLVQSSVMKNTPTRADLMNDYFSQMCNQGKFKDVYAASVYKNSEKAFTITQIYSGGGMPKSSSVSMLFANNEVYTVFIIISYTEESFDRNIGLWDVEHLANAWLARIQVDGETVPNSSSRGSSSVKKSLPTEAKTKETTTKSVSSKSKQGKATKKSAKDASPQTREKDDHGFPIANCESLLNRKPKKTAGPNHFDLKIIYNEVIKNSSTGVILYYYDKVWPGFADKREELLHSADEMVKLFRNDSIESDVESELRQGYIRNVRTLRVLRSFVWTSVEYCETNEVDLADFSLEQAIDLAQFLFDRDGMNYEIAGKKNKSIWSGLLKKSEKDFYFYGEDYVNIVQSLLALLPVMKRIHGYLLEKQEVLSDTDITLKDIFAGWCAFSLACFTNILVKVGPDDYIPQKCRELPVDTDFLRVIEGCYYVDQDNNCVAYTGSGDLIDFPEGIKSVIIPEEYSKISGSREYWNHTGTIVFPTTFVPYRYVNHDCGKFVKRLVFKGDTDIIDSWSSTNKDELEEIEFLGKGNTIGDNAFWHYPKLRKVVLPENLTVIEESAFSQLPLLKEIRIPPNVKEIGVDAFGHYDGNTTLLIVEKGSVAEETVRNYIANKDNFDIAEKDSVKMKVVLSEAEQKLQAFEQKISSLIALSKQPVLTRIENGDEKNAIVGQIISRAKALVGDGAELSSGLAKYDGNAELESLRLTLGREFASAEEIIDAIAEKKSAECDRFSALFEKKKTDIRIARQEAAKLEEERSHLGIFQGKRKKEIAAMLEQIQVRIKLIEANYENEKKQ